LQRAAALERLGHIVSIIDPFDWIGRSAWTWRWLHYAGGFGIGAKIDRPIFDAIKQSEPGLVWVDQGAYLGAGLIANLRTLSVPIVNYTLDDPFSGRDGRRFDRYLKALPFYDLLVVIREENVAEAYARGARNVLRVWRSADEVAHRPRLLTDEDRQRWGAEVCFVGTWFPERGPFMAELVRAGLPLSIWGDRWQKAPEWPVLAPHWRGPGQDDPEIYARIIQSAKISLGLLSKGNRDRHTTRSFEIPAIGGLLCAERTDEYCQSYKEGVEAVFWDDAEECIEQCRRLLKDDALVAAIKKNGHQRYLQSGQNNESVLKAILNHEALLNRQESKITDS
jgi:spore maturation protein CgeB